MSTSNQYQIVFKKQFGDIVAKFCLDQRFPKSYSDVGTAGSSDGTGIETGGGGALIVLQQLWCCGDPGAFTLTLGWSGFLYKNQKCALIPHRSDL